MPKERGANSPKPPFPLDPRGIPHLAPEDVHELLDRWFSSFPATTLQELPAVPHGRALVFGDTHSDWPTVEALSREAMTPQGPLTHLVGLGDYVDRTLPELPHGSVVNALFLLSLRLCHPDRVVLLRGNHETQHLIPILRPEAVDESDELWGRESGVGRRIEQAFDRLPLMATTESGGYLAHAGFPRERNPKGWKTHLDARSLKLLEEVVWNDLEVSSFSGGRGLEISPISQAETLEFLSQAGCSVFLRGHDPTEAGKARYDNRVLTLHTSRVYDWAGLHVAELPLDGRVRDLRDVRCRRIEPPPIPTP
ncbi:MAG: serine/threonine protein phosphatase [Euryarchaeota archaeon]|nr:serine/threonine protein phosphatase [Euryarchaeota archaeon]MDE1835254.1 serine/threonine protein phosphatase [Euryarchaeota archaeon]MDE1881084.1 serine/threonine protein phosphatase [Euryarchaeota archaeon]MDE2043550.1 serine/threonine protein phosphatase [Thermoplasmata archaeon]